MKACPEVIGLTTLLFSFQKKHFSLLGFIAGFTTEGNIKVECQTNGHKRGGENVLIP